MTYGTLSVSGGFLITGIPADVDELYFTTTDLGTEVELFMGGREERGLFGRIRGSTMYASDLSNAPAGTTVHFAPIRSRAPNTFHQVGDPQVFSGVVGDGPELTAPGALKTLLAETGFPAEAKLVGTYDEDYPIPITGYQVCYDVPVEEWFERENRIGGTNAVITQVATVPTSDTPGQNSYGRTVRLSYPPIQPDGSVTYPNYFNFLGIQLPSDWTTISGPVYTASITFYAGSFEQEGIVARLSFHLTDNSMSGGGLRGDDNPFNSTIFDNLRARVHSESQSLTNTLIPGTNGSWSWFRPTGTLSFTIDTSTAGNAMRMAMYDFLDAVGQTSFDVHLYDNTDSPISFVVAPGDGSNGDLAVVGTNRLYAKNVGGIWTNLTEFDLSGGNSVVRVLNAPPVVSDGDVGDWALHKPSGERTRAWRKGGPTWNEKTRLANVTTVTTMNRPPHPNNAGL